MLCLLLMLTSRILGLIWRGTAYFHVNDTNIFLTGEWRQRSKCGLPNAGDPFFGAKLKAWRHKLFKCSSLICFCQIINRFSLWMPSLVRNVIRLQWHFDIRPTDTQICRCFKVHELITCESKVQVVVSLGSYEVLFALGHHEDLTNDTWRALLQSEHVFELGGITTDIWAFRFVRRAILWKK